MTTRRPDGQLCSLPSCDGPAVYGRPMLCGAHRSRLKFKGDVMADVPVARQAMSVEDRFMSHVAKDPASGCWNWTGSRDRKGYGSTGRGKAHRVSWELFRGAIGAGLQIDHLCRNHSCVNPEHLEPVTPAENTRRGHAARGPQPFCKRGHVFEGDNVVVRRDGRRRCRVCNRQRVREYKQRQCAA